MKIAFLSLSFLVVVAACAPSPDSSEGRNAATHSEAGGAPESATGSGTDSAGIGAVSSAAPRWSDIAGSNDATVDAKDSAGIRIVSSKTPRWSGAAGLRLSESPVLEIGSGTPDSLHQFTGIVSIVRLSDGRIVVGNSKPTIIRVYSPQGKFLHNVGRQGQGPGEYQNYEAVLRLPGDSLLVTAFGKAGSIFGADGKMGRTVRLEKAPRDLSEGAGGSGFAPRPVGTFSDGSLLSFAALTDGELRADPKPGENGVVSDSIEFHHYSPAGVRLSSYGAFDFFERFVAGQFNAIRAASPERSWATGPDRFYTGNGRSFEIRAYATDGTLKEILRAAIPPVRLTADSIAKRKEKRMAAATTPERRREIEEYYRVMKFPSSLPQFNDLLAPYDGGIWVREYSTATTPPSPARWHAFGSDGSWLGSVEVPPRFSLKAVAGDLAYGVALDADDVESVRVYRIIRGGG